MGRNRLVALAWIGLLTAGFMASPALAEVGDYGQTSNVDAVRIETAIMTLRAKGLNNGAIQYALGLDGITVPDAVLNGGKTVREAIYDGSIKQGVPAAYAAPPIAPTAPPAPPPDLSPKGSSAGGWTPETVVPAIKSMRQSIMGTTKPPGC